MNELEIKLMPSNLINDEFNLDKIIYDLDIEIERKSFNPDTLDYFVSIASGVLCALLDILWVGDFDLEKCYDMSSEKAENFVKQIAKKMGCKSDEMDSCVKFLEEKFRIPSDGNTPDFGGGLQHHLRDFAHHPTIVGLFFSLLTQFTMKSYGTKTDGTFTIVDVPEKSKIFIGDSIPTKLIYGTLTWFFHLVSDMAGSSGSASKSGGTGIPGPILSLAKELSAIPIFHNISVDDIELSKFISKLFNGTLLAQHDENGRIIKGTEIKFDLRTEMGIVAKLGQQSLPVLANECIVRCFYFVRRFASEIKKYEINNIKDLSQINWNDVKPFNNPTLTRMLLISTGVFTTLDVAEAIVTQKYFVSINYVGVGRFALAIGQDISWSLKTRKLKEIKKMYENIKRNTFRKEDGEIYSRMNNSFSTEELGLTLEQVEILYNIEYYITLNDINNTILKQDNIITLKTEWLNEWKEHMSKGFASFVQVPDAELHWYSKDELYNIIESNNPDKVWFRLVLLETMIFEPYFPLKLDKNKKGELVPSTKYKLLTSPVVGTLVLGFHNNNAKKYIEELFIDKPYYQKGFIERLDKCYRNALNELNEVTKNIIKGLVITGVIAFATVLTAGMLAPKIAVLLVGSNFAGLHGAALTSACLAYLGGGAIAVGGAGMAGGTVAIVGGGAILGATVGVGVGGSIGAAGIINKRNTIAQSAKLIVSIREIFLNDEKNLELSNTLYEEYVKRITEIEHGVVDLKSEIENSELSDTEIKDIKKLIKDAEETVKLMKIAKANLKKFKSSFEIGLSYNQNDQD